MPPVTIARSPLVPGRSPVSIHVRERGAGPAVVLLHGGWGYEAYPFDAALGTLGAHHRVIAPDRAGYGRSDPVPVLRPGFQRLMAEETIALLDALGVERASLWGHSDGAVIAAWAAILFPRRVGALVLEAFHFWKAKVSSLQFFRDGAEAPERFGEAVVRALVRDHGEAWREVVARGSRAWLEIIEEGRRDGRDLYDGRLGEIRAPALFLHGRHDPRTEPGEIEAALAALPSARIEWLDAGHGPHASATAGASTLEHAAAFLRAHAER